MGKKGGVTVSLERKVKSSKTPEEAFDNLSKSISTLDKVQVAARVPLGELGSIEFMMFGDQDNIEGHATWLVGVALRVRKKFDAEVEENRKAQRALEKQRNREFEDEAIEREKRLRAAGFREEPAPGPG